MISRRISLALLISGFIFLVSGCTNLFFVPDRQLILEPDRLKLEFNNLSIPTADGEILHGWLLKGQEPVKGTVIFLHGNAQNISYHIASVRWLPKYHYNVFLYDYRGYGKSTGKATLENSIGDFTSVIDMLNETLPLNQQTYSVFGQSLGGALAIAAVSQNQHDTGFNSLIIDSAFSGFRTIAKEKMSNLLLTKPFSGALKYLFSAQPNLLEEIATIESTRVLVLHGLNDKIVPPTHAEQLYAAATQPKTLHLEPGAKHIQSLANSAVRELMLKTLSN